MADDVTNKEKSLKARLSSVRMLRNNAYHGKVDEFLNVVADQSEEEALRVALAEALGWFKLSRNRDAIVSAFKEVAANPQTTAKLKEELLKSAARIEVYMR
jgi:ParB-like chromosome segregation protein Spo0J